MAKSKAKKENPKATEPASKKGWVSDAADLVNVEKKRESAKLKSKDGTVKGGTEYYGEKK